MGPSPPAGDDQQHPSHRRRGGYCRNLFRGQAVGTGAQLKELLDLHVWQWPQCIGMFSLGALLSGSGWARAIPRNIARRCGIALVLTLVAAEAVAWGSGRQELCPDGGPFLGRWRWRTPCP